MTIHFQMHLAMLYTTPSIGSEVVIITSSYMGSSCENEEVQESDEEGL